MHKSITQKDALKKLNAVCAHPKLISLTGETLSTALAKLYIANEDLKKTCFDALSISEDEATLTVTPAGSQVILSGTTKGDPPVTKKIIIAPFLSKIEYSFLPSLDFFKPSALPDARAHLDGDTATKLSARTETGIVRRTKFNKFKRGMIGTSKNPNSLFAAYVRAILSDRFMSAFERHFHSALAIKPAISYDNFKQEVKPSYIADAKNGEVIFNFEFRGVKAGFKVTIDKPEPAKVTYQSYAASSDPENPLSPEEFQRISDRLLSFTKADHQLMAAQSSNIHLHRASQSVSILLPSTIKLTLSSRPEVRTTLGKSANGASAAKTWPPVSATSPDLAAFKTLPPYSMKASSASEIRIQLQDSHGKDIVKSIPNDAFKTKESLEGYLVGIYSSLGRSEGKSMVDLNVILPAKEAIDPQVKKLILQNLTALKKEGWKMNFIMPAKNGAKEPTKKPGPRP